MAKLIYGMMQSLDGYVDHLVLPGPGPALFRHFIEHVRSLSGALYGSRIYQLMRYWDDDQRGWTEAEQEFAKVWRAMPKWVASNSLTSLGPNAQLISGDLGEFVRDLKRQAPSELEVAGPALAGSLTDLGLIDEYRLYLRPYVLGSGKPFFAGARPPLRFVGSDLIGEDAVRLTYTPEA